MTGLLVTGFGPFMSVEENPSGLLAARFPDHTVLPVSYRAVDEWLSADPLRDFQAILMLGVARSAHFRLELFAHNEVRGIPDIEGNTPVGSIIEDAHPILGATLWPVSLLDKRTQKMRPSTDPGRYLCNYIAYRVLHQYPGKKCGFLHVPPLELMALEDQMKVVRRVVGKISASW